MDVDSMESEADALKRKSEELQSLSSGSISLSVSNLSASSRVIPSDEDFHFYYNFNEFRCPIDEIAAKSQLMLQQIGSAKQLWGEEAVSPEDMDDGYEWLVNVNDEVFERFDMSVDEFLKARKAAEEGEEGAMNDDGFQLVYGKKKNKAVASVGGGMRGNESVWVKVVERDNKVAGPKPKVPFHIPTIRKPQEEFKIVANNSNEPFQHVWLERIEDGSRFIHPLEKLDVLDFIDHNIEHLEPLKPSSLESTPFKLVEEVRDLKELAAHLRCVKEFAVDLEHNQYRSFQGLTCLMQVSTRTEDFIVDTLKLRTHVGPYLREIFKDPTKRKVMHGADRDITWLQKDFSIYVCNLFDTGQASRVLKLERNSLEYLLQHFCGVTANKEYQNADWRLRPLPREMIRYAREDTHYLLYIYDLMRIRLHSESTAGKRDALLVEVYKRSYDICLQLYEKELLTDTSYLYIYGLQSANFNAQQLAIVAGLYEWRDVVAREEDESTGYILPNKTLLEIAKQIPLTTNKLRRFVRSKQPYVERNLGSVVSIIRHSIQNAAAFEIVAQQLREGLIKAGPKSSAADTDRSEASLCSEYSRVMKTADAETEGGSAIDGGLHAQMETLLNSDENVEHGGHVGPQKNPIQDPMMDIHQSGNMMNSTLNILEFSKDAGAMVNVMKKPGSPFGALLGSSMIKAKNNSNRKDKEENKLEQIKSSVNLPFHSFKFRTQQSEAQEDQSRNSGPLHTNTEESPIKSSTTNREDIIPLEDEQNDLDAQETRDNPSGTEQPEASKSKYDEEDEPMSLSDLSSSFRKCLESVNENHKTKQSGLVQFEPFDYEAARKQVKFGGVAERDSVVGDDGEGSTKRLGSSARKKGSSGVDQSMNDGGGLRQGRRRQAFPASGNRSATFR